MQPEILCRKNPSKERMERVKIRVKNIRLIRISSIRMNVFITRYNVHLNVPKGLRNEDLLQCFLTFSTNKYLLFSFRSNALLNAIYMLGLGLTDEIRTYLASTRILQLPQIIGPLTEMKIFQIFCNVIHHWIPGLILKESFGITIL